MMKRKRGFTLIELMAVIAIASIAMVMLSSVFIQGYKIINRTENKTTIQNDFRIVMMNIENDIKGVPINEVIGQSEFGVANLENKAEVEYKGKVYEGRYIVDLSTLEKAYFEVEVENGKQLWESKYVSKSISGDKVHYVIDDNNNNILMSNMGMDKSIVAKSKDGILVFNMNEDIITAEYYGSVNTANNKDINVGTVNEGDGSGTEGTRQPILLSNSQGGTVKIKSTNKEVFFDNQKLDNYYVINSKNYSQEISNAPYGIVNNKNEGISIPLYKNFGYKENITLENIDESLYLDRNVKITNIGSDAEEKKLSEGILYFTVDNYKIYLFNTKNLIINNTNTNNLRWNKMELTDTIIICSGNIEINNGSYCSTNLSGSMIAGNNVRLNNNDGSIIMYSQSESRRSISEGTINRIKRIVNKYSS